MCVYVISKDGQPLMPTRRFGKVRRMLKEGNAIVVRRCPFTIKLLYETECNVQEITLGVDAGSKHIGLSAATESSELYAAEVELRGDVSKNLAVRREMRRARRNRKTRYRKARFDNRVRSKHKGWLAPSVEQKVQTHLTAINRVCRILPVSKIVIETASFDLQKIKALEEGRPLPEGTDYQEGEQLDFWNVREFVLFRDGHVCQCCKGKSKDPVLNVHHIESRLTGGNAPNNLITLCKTCHTGYHAGTVILPQNIKRGAAFKDAAFMGIMRWTVYNRLKKVYPDVSLTYGYITKNTRIRAGLPKTHVVDARCISGHKDAKPLGYVYYQKKIRCHNRQIHKMSIPKGGIRKRNQAPHLVKGYRLFDKVSYHGEECFIFGRRSSGSFDIRTLGGEKLSAGVSFKKLTFLETKHSYLTERRPA